MLESSLLLVNTLKNVSHWLEIDVISFVWNYAVHAAVH